MNDHGESDDTNGDGEGVWSPDIEQCFREALLLFPPCGRRKHILQEEGGGKMYGRNELIARHIMMRTGKSRTRKQVSSHIQVLARRKAKAEAASNGGSQTGVSPSPTIGGGLRANSTSSRNDSPAQQQQQPSSYYDVWMDRPIVSQKIRLVEFSAFIEHRNFDSVNSGTILTSQQQQPSVDGLIGGNGQRIINADQTGLPIKFEPVNESNSTQAFNVIPHHQGQSTTTTHPLASNHHLPAQFNQATYQTTNHNLQSSHHHQVNHHQKVAIHGQGALCMPANSHQLTQQQQQQQSGSSSGFVRHSYVKIDYRQTISHQSNKLESIDISQIQDKFPEIGGSEGLFQRGPPNAFFLVKFWADINNDYEYNIDDQNSYFGFSSHFETIDPYKDITCSTKACSYGLQVVEKVEKIYCAFNSSNGRYSYDINRSPMCEFMIQFIKKLRQLQTSQQMNSVLENFTVLQVITSESTSEILLCLAYVFEVASDQNNGPQHHVYRLTKD